MDKENTVMEKRTYQRFETKEGAYAAVTPSSYKIGRIVNISLGGLVFRYTDREEELDTFGDDTIFLGSYGFSVGDLPFRTVDIEPVPEVEGIELYEEDGVAFSDTPSSSPMKAREQRVEFTELTFKQIFAVDKFIRENMRQSDLNLIQVMVE